MRVGSLTIPHEALPRAARARSQKTFWQISPELNLRCRSEYGTYGKKVGRKRIVSHSKKIPIQYSRTSCARVFLSQEEVCWF
jgi:hypothetical protein